MPTRAIVLAAGQGKRMRSKKSKLLHDLLGQPILGRVLKALDDMALEHIHIVVGYEADQIRGFLSDYNAHTPISWHLQDPQQGTGHALMQVEAALKNFKGDLLVTAGDTPLLTSKTLREFVRKHSSENADVSVITVALEDAKSYGRIIRSDSGHIIAIVEDRDATLEQKHIREINSAIYCFRWPQIRKGLNALTNRNKQKEYYLPDLIAWAHGEKLRISSFQGTDWREFAGINSRLELAEASRFLRDNVVERLALENGVTIIDPQSTWIAPEVDIGQDTIVMPGCWLIGNIKIGSACTIGPHTSIQGSVHIGSKSNILQSHLIDCQVGSDCQVGPFTHIRPGTVLSDHVKAGNFVEIKKSFVGLNTNISHLSYVGDATIGSKSNIGAGTIVANYDHITKAKARTIIGDGAATGSNSVLVAPVTLGHDCFVAAGTVVTRSVPAGTLAVGRARQENVEGWTDKRRRLAGSSQPKPEAKSKAKIKSKSKPKSKAKSKPKPKQKSKGKRKKR